MNPLEGESDAGAIVGFSTFDIIPVPPGWTAGVTSLLFIWLPIWCPVGRYLPYHLLFSYKWYLLTCPFSLYVAVTTKHVLVQAAHCFCHHPGLCLMMTCPSLTLASWGLWGRFCCSHIPPPHVVLFYVLHLLGVAAKIRALRDLNCIFLVARGTSASTVWVPSPHELHLLHTFSRGRSCDCKVLHWVGSALMGSRFAESQGQLSSKYLLGGHYTGPNGPPNR